MKLILTPEVSKRLESLRAEVARLEELEARGVVFELAGKDRQLTETEKLEVIEHKARELNPDTIRAMLHFTIEMCSVCYHAGANEREPLTTFVSNLAAMAKRTGRGPAH